MAQQTFAGVPTEFTAGEVLSSSDQNLLRNYLIAQIKEGMTGDTGEILPMIMDLTNNRIVLDSGGLEFSDGSTQTVASVAATNATAEVTTTQSTTSGSWTDLSTAGPSVALATGTKALVLITAFMDPSTSSGANLVFYVGCDITGATTQAPDGSNFDTLANWPRGASGGLRATAAVLFTGLTAGTNTFKLMYKSGDGSSTGYFRYRQIAVIDMGS